VKRLPQSIAVFAAALLLAMFCFGQAASGKKEYTFHGKVEAVDKNAKSLRVNGEKVDGWMGAMTMDYKVDNPSVLDKLRPGDRVMATVYDGDYTLHQVKPMLPDPDSKSKK
jgi:Cu/Ag efflux protein CusF